ncbi:SGNH hydrolase-type esterase domain-containing protein [Hypoxylon sp. FL1857]|nr:SGNH hydrolase-type esterase domain-containing protein [Hypoxylon sp. FL1857]
MRMRSQYENQNISDRTFQEVLIRHAKYKEYSYEESRVSHVPLLQSNPPLSFDVVLLGDSMIERFKTTAQYKDFWHWPSKNIIHALNTSSSPSKSPRLHGLFNAGVSDDGYENIIYRLVGDGLHLQGLKDILKDRNIKLWVIHAGTNNLNWALGLQERNVMDLRLILQTLFRISKPKTNILLTGLFYRYDIEDDVIDRANLRLRCLVELMNSNIPGKRISFLPAPTTIETDSHYDDHIHLNEEGYRLWINELWPRMCEILDAIGDEA